MFVCKKCLHEQETGVTCDLCGGTLIMLEEEYKIDINNDHPAVLQQLNGVGPVLAEEIVRNRPYQYLTDLTKIDGISTNMVQEWADYAKT